VVRAFGGEDVTQVEGNTVNPLRDVDTLMAELLRIDQQTAAREYRPLETQVEKKQGGTALAADCAAMQKVEWQTCIYHRNHRSMVVRLPLFSPHSNLSTQSY